MISTNTRIEIVVCRSQFRRWHERLRNRLARVFPKAEISFRLTEEGAAWPPVVDHLLSLEKVILRSRLEALSDRVPAPIEPAAGRGAVVIDLTGNAEGSLQPFYDGERSEIAAIAALLNGATPRLSTQDGEGATLAFALPSFEGATGLVGKLDAVLSRVITMLEQALASPRREIAPPQRQSNALGGASIARHLFFSAQHMAQQKIANLCCHGIHWRVGWRFVEDGGDVLTRGSLDGAPWRILPDAAMSFNGDPFPFEWRGRYFIFYESLDYRTDKGVIFAQEIGDSGAIGEPVLALEAPWHLSYPMLLEENGELYMAPEASLSGAITLYRCIDFPSRWEPVAELVTDIEAADATIFTHDGRYWMTAVVRDGIGGYSDTLAINYADRLTGPWRQHARQPALIDASCARPAGGVVLRNGALLRPTQDCANGYGRAITIMRIDRLDPETFEETPLRRIAPGGPWPGARLHTLNRWGRLECIDGAIFTPKPFALRRVAHRLIDRMAGVAD